MSLNEIILRIKSNHALKLMLSVILTGGFPLIYFGLLQSHQMFPVRIMPVSWLDRMIPFVPDTVYLYESIWLLMPIAPWLTKTRNELNAYWIGFAVMSIVGFSIFFFFPTAVLRPNNIQNTNVLYEALIRFDNGINACPSFHAALAVFHGACCHLIFSRGRWNRLIQGVIWVWVLGILAATLLTKQHVFVDIVAGIILGVGGFVVLRFREYSLLQERNLHEK